MTGLELPTGVDSC